MKGRCSITKERGQRHGDEQGIHPRHQLVGGHKNNSQVAATALYITDAQTTKLSHHASQREVIPATP